MDHRNVNPLLEGDNLEFLLREATARVHQLRDHSSNLLKAIETGSLPPIITAEAARQVADEQLDRAKKLQELIERCEDGEE